MTPEQYGRVKEVFTAAVELPRDLQADFAHQRCGADEQVLEQVLSLLRHHRDATVLDLRDGVATLSGTTRTTGTARTTGNIVYTDQRVDEYLVLKDVWEDNRQILRRRLIVIGWVLASLIAMSMLRLLTYRYAAQGYFVRVSAMAVSLGCSGLLYRKPKLSLLQLRFVELMVMANAGLLAIVLYLRVVQDAALREDYVDLISINNWNFFTWTLLIFVYGVFMPNTWRRAAIVVLPLAAIPTLLLVLSHALQPAIPKLLEMDEYGRPFPAPLIAACISIYAAHLIHDSRLTTFGARQLAQYQLIRLIGLGGMGEVFEAEHRMLKRPCAIKIIHPNDSLDENAAASFAREVRATASLTHPHTVEIYDYGQTRDGLFFCAMEMLPGLNLRDMVQRFGPLPACRVVHFLSEVCGALCEAHGAGLIHRDIKPANIFASQRGGIDDFTKLLDFGLVREIQISESTGPHSGMIAGTPEFMSPEQITSPDRMDARSDLYSLGAVGYFLLTGRPPFMANSPLETMLARVRDTPSLPSDYQQGIPGDLEQVIMRCLQTDASLRPTTAEQLLAELQKCDCAGEWTAKDAAGWWKRVVNLTAVKPNFGNKDSGSKFSTASTCE